MLGRIEGIRTPLRHIDQPRLHQLEPLEEPQDLRARPRHERRRPPQHRPDPCRHLRKALRTGMRHHQIAAGRHGVPKPGHDPNGVLDVGDGVQDGHQQDRDRVAEIDERPQLRAIQQLPWSAQVRLDDGHPVGAGQQRPAMEEDDRVGVHVEHPGIGRDLMRDLMHVALGGKARADVQELADPRLRGQEPHGPSQEGAVLPCHHPQLRRNSKRLFCDGAIDGEVVLAAKQVVVHPGEVRDARIDAGRCCPALGCLVCHRCSSTRPNRQRPDRGAPPARRVPQTLRRLPPGRPGGVHTAQTIFPWLSSGVQLRCNPAQSGRTNMPPKTATSHATTKRTTDRSMDGGHLPRHARPSGSALSGSSR